MHFRRMNDRGVARNTILGVLVVFVGVTLTLTLSSRQSNPPTSDSAARSAESRPAETPDASSGGSAAGNEHPATPRSPASNPNPVQPPAQQPAQSATQGATPAPLPLPLPGAPVTKATPVPDGQAPAAPADAARISPEGAPVAASETGRAKPESAETKESSPDSGSGDAAPSAKPDSSGSALSSALPSAPPAVPLVDRLNPPTDSQEKFVAFMKEKRGEDEKYLAQRYQRAQLLLANTDLWNDKALKAFLLTPREKFCRKWNLNRAYDRSFQDIRHGVTISGPHLVGRMTSALDVQPGDKVLEIGTGSGYHSAMISSLTDRVYTIEIIEPLAKETDAIYAELTAAGYAEFGKITRKSDDGYYGWEEHAPFDKIVVTCGIDHIPPPLLKQLRVGGSMVIPVGPPGAQVILKVTKTEDRDGNTIITREDIYHGKKKEAFVPFTAKGGGVHHK